ncbi:hypothetical protein [Streptomyces sp. NPDC000878]
MFLSGRSVPAARSPVRGGRIALLCLLVLVGSPWAQPHVRDFYRTHYGNEPLQWLTEGAFVPGWGSSTERYVSAWDRYLYEPNVSDSALVVENLCVVLLLAALAFAMPRLSARGTSGWIGCVAVGVLISELVALLRWGLIGVFAHEDLQLITMWSELPDASLAFGLSVGVLIALLTAGLPGAQTTGSTGVRLTRTAGAGKALFRQRKGEAGMTAPQVHMPVGRVPGDVTRYLCAAAYVDERFADRVVEGVVADEASAPAPSPEVDLVAVARHCLAAKEIHFRRDLRLAAAFGAVALLAPLWLLVSASALSVVAGAARGRPSLATRGRHQPDSRALTGTVITAGIVVLCAFALGVAVAVMPVSGLAAWLLGAYLGGVPAVLTSVGAVLFAYVTVVRHELDTDLLLRTTMTRETFARQPLPAVPPRKWIARRLAALKEARDGNVTLYSGFTPFVGYAGTHSNWSVAVPLLPADDPVDPGARPGEPEVFTVVELVGHVREQLRTVAARGDSDGIADAGPEALGSLTIEDRVFASGTSVGDDDRFTNPTGLVPAARLSPEAVEEIMLSPTGTVRHCLAVHVPLWGGDVVPSVFLHFSTAGRTLHLHCDNHVLGPVDAAYHVVDRLRDPLTPERRRGLLTDALARTGPAFFGAPLRALAHARFEARRTRRTTDETTAMDQDPAFDHGARLSIREMALSPRYHNYFQVVDAGRITAAVERHTLAAIREFLDTRGYDITDFRSQQQTILNQGLIQQGGVSVIGNQAIGSGASATQNIAQKPGPAAGVPQK